MGDRGSLWKAPEVTILITEWGSEKIQKMISTAKSHKDVFEKIAVKLPGRDALSCQKKIQALRRQYLKYKDSVSKTRRSSNSDIPMPNSIANHYDLLDSILSDRPVTSSVVLESSDVEEYVLTPAEDDVGSLKIIAVKSEVSELNAEKMKVVPKPAKRQKLARESKDKFLQSISEITSNLFETNRRQEDERMQAFMNFQEKQIEKEREHELKVLQILTKNNYSMEPK
ncbi:unnamed protein product [Clavelina lepadiformis]|uniref:Myb/SANT-like DNA-binding domain-containing protein n=1 Tax=Clavelina lepadiformis TaxID=159417 RepID=A0ABP0GAH8_CLALP